MAKLLWFFGAALLIGLAAGAVGFQSASKRVLFLNLTTNDAWTNEMALSYGARALDAGHRVVVFLNVRAVEVARRTPAPDLKKANESLVDLQKRGAEIHVCRACTLRSGMTPVDDWIEGAKTGSDETMRIQMDSGTSVMSY